MDGTQLSQTKPCDLQGSSALHGAPNSPSGYNVVVFSALWSNVRLSACMVCAVEQWLLPRHHARQHSECGAAASSRPPHVWCQLSPPLLPEVLTATRRGGGNAGPQRGPAEFTPPEVAPPPNVSPSETPGRPVRPPDIPDPETDPMKNPDRRRELVDPEPSRPDSE